MLIHLLIVALLVSVRVMRVYESVIIVLIPVQSKKTYVQIDLIYLILTVIVIVIIFQIILTALLEEIHVWLI